jgi:hypothetical protein
MSAAEAPTQASRQGQPDGRFSRRSKGLRHVLSEAKDPLRVGDPSLRSGSKVSPPDVILINENFGDTNEFAFDVRRSKRDDFLQSLAARRLTPQ